MPDDDVRGTPGDRKVVLARLLASAEVQRLGIEPARSEVLSVARWWKAEFGLDTPGRFDAWLEYSGLGFTRFCEMMWRFAALTKLLQHYQEEIDHAMVDHHAVHSINAFIQGGIHDSL